MPSERIELDPKYYLAAGFHRQEEVHQLRGFLREYMPRWRCTSRWLNKAHQNLDRVQCAEIDYADIARASVLVLLHGGSTTGGMWTELGIGIQRRMPIFIVHLKGSEHEKYRSSVFTYMRAIEHIWAIDLREAALEIRDKIDRLVHPIIPKEEFFYTPGIIND